MKVTRSVLLIAIVVVVSTLAAVTHLADETFEFPALRVRP